MSGVFPERTPQVTGELLSNRQIGAYHQLTFVAPDVAKVAEPGQFVALAVGGDTSANLLRRCFSIYKVSPGVDGGTVDIVVAARGAGTRWLTGLSAHDSVNSPTRETRDVTSPPCSLPSPADWTTSCRRAPERRLSATQ